MSTKVEVREYHELWLGYLKFAFVNLLDMDLVIQEAN